MQTPDTFTAGFDIVAVTPEELAKRMGCSVIEAFNFQAQCAEALAKALMVAKPARAAAGLIDAEAEEVDDADA